MCAQVESGTQGGTSTSQVKSVAFSQAANCHPSSKQFYRTSKKDTSHTADHYTRNVNILAFLFMKNVVLLEKVPKFGSEGAVDCHLLPSEFIFVFQKMQNQS